MALSQNIQVKSLNKGYFVTRKANAADHFYKGALVNILQSSGKLVVAADTASHMFDGYVAEDVNATAADVEVKVIKSDIAWFYNASAAQTDIGKPVYATADDTLSISVATNVLPCGQIVDVDLVNDYWLVDFSKAVIRDLNT